MERKEFFIKVEVNVNNKTQRADVIIHTSPETVEQAEWKEIEADIIEKVEKELEKAGKGFFKIVARVKVDDKVDDKEEIFESLSSMLRDPETLKKYLSGFTPEGLKKAEEIVLSSKYVTPAELVKKAKQELNGADLANFIARVPLIVEVNKAIGAGVKGSDFATHFIVLILAQLTPEKPTELNLKKGTDILKIILTADTKAVMDTTSTLIDCIKEFENEKD